MEKIMKYILRGVVSPFVFGIILVAHTVAAFIRVINFIRFGGEFTNYKRDEKITIQAIYNELIEARATKILDDLEREDFESILK